MSLALAACRGDGAERRYTGVQDEAKPALGLMSTLPIYWPESARFGDLLDEDVEKNWVRRALENRFELDPLDTLSDHALADVDHLILAQPRALSAEENVALDGWVRRGGRALIFADPMLTRESLFAIGDRRRPQDVALLSPILTHWGLELAYDTAQDEGERVVEAEGTKLPVNLAGTFAARPGPASAACKIAADGLLAECEVGAGRVTLLADAAILDGESEASRAGLDWVVAKAFRR